MIWVFLSRMDCQLFLPLTFRKDGEELWVSRYLYQGETYFFNYIMINSESIFSTFPHIFLFSVSRSPLWWLSFSAQQFVEERSREAKWWLNCYYNAGLKHSRAKWMRRRPYRGFPNDRGEARSKPIDASSAKFIYKKSVYFSVLILKVLVQ